MTDAGVPYETPADLVERACDRFESDWCAGQAPEIADFLPTATGAGCEAEEIVRHECLVELVRVDLEYRWRRAAQGHGDAPFPLAGEDRAADAPSALVGEGSAADEPSPLVGEDRGRGKNLHDAKQLNSGMQPPPHSEPKYPVLPERPLLEDYFRQYPQLADATDRLGELIADEYCVRQRYGDCPGWDEYARRFAQFTPQVRAALRRVRERMTADSEAVGVRVDDEQGRVVYTGLLRGLIELGRQRLTEDPPRATLRSEGVTRIVIADKEDTTISRRHVQLSQRQDQTLRLTNISEKRPLVIVRGPILAPGESVELQLPAVIFVGAKSVRLS